jgi:lipopolysaccharide export system protein LptA
MRIVARLYSLGCLYAVLSCLAWPGAALAERADREKPINIEADRITLDDRNKVQVLEGRVVMTQGTLVLRADKIVVTQDPEGFQKGVATSGPGGLARFRQKQDGKDEYIEGEAERIEHDTRTEATQFFVRAYVKSGQDEVRGQYISYDGRTENYLVTSGPNATTAAAGGPRVRAVIQPKNKDAARKPETGKPNESAAMKSSSDIAKPRSE